MTAVVIAVVDHYHGVEIGRITNEPGPLLLYGFTKAACAGLAATLFLWRGQSTYGIVMAAAFSNASWAGPPALMCLRTVR